MSLEKFQSLCTKLRNVKRCKLKSNIAVRKMKNSTSSYSVLPRGGRNQENVLIVRIPLISNTSHRMQKWSYEILSTSSYSVLPHGGRSASAWKNTVTTRRILYFSDYNIRFLLTTFHLIMRKCRKYLSLNPYNLTFNIS